MGNTLRYCEGPHGDTKPEATIIHTYNDTDHWFCSNKCHQLWWFHRQREEGVDVNTIPLTRNGEAVICNHCNEPLLYGGLGDMRCDFVDDDLTYTFCSPDHQDAFHKERQND